MYNNTRYRLNKLSNSMKSRYEVVVIGAGPAGNFAAFEAARKVSSELPKLQG
jgi:alkyl hydroperoxide reductase subunit AhpF